MAVKRSCTQHNEINKVGVVMYLNNYINTVYKKHKRIIAIVVMFLLLCVFQMVQVRYYWPDINEGRSINNIIVGILMFVLGVSVFDKAERSEAVAVIVCYYVSEAIIYWLFPLEYIAYGASRGSFINDCVCLLYDYAASSIYVLFGAASYCLLSMIDNVVRKIYVNKSQKN